MGTDIHFYVEKLVGDQWVTADNWFKDEDDGQLSTYKWGPGLKIEAGPMYHGRNYRLFAMLADVRNGRGFAGVDTGNRINPIHPPRGLPEDVCPEVKAASKNYGIDGHSHSWATVAELMKYDWTQTATLRGWVGPKEFLRWKLGGLPESWSGGVGGGGIEHVSNEDMEKRLKNDFGTEELEWRHLHALENDLLSAAASYTQIEWHIPYSEAADEFLSQTMPKLWRIGDPDKVRIVFFFDN